MIVCMFQHEEEVYADANNCINTVEEHYHRDVMEMRSGHQCTKVLL